MEVEWEPQKEYEDRVECYELEWSENCEDCQQWRRACKGCEQWRVACAGCQQWEGSCEGCEQWREACGGCEQWNGSCVGCEHHMLLNASLRSAVIPVQPCTEYTIRIIAHDSANVSNVPAVLTQMTASDALANGTALIVTGRWAVLRWLQSRVCPNSTHVVICHGPNTRFNFKIHPAEGVVLFNVSGLLEYSRYVCVAFTYNSAGSSLASNPLHFTTGRNLIIGFDKSPPHMVIPTVVVFFTIAVLLLVALLIKKGGIKVPWRGSYSVNKGTQETPC